MRICELNKAEPSAAAGLVVVHDETSLNFPKLGKRLNKISLGATDRNTLHMHLALESLLVVFVDFALLSKRLDIYLTSAGDLPLCLG